MTPERWQQVKSTLADALEQDDTAARLALLDTRCADDTGLRREVESLLRQSGESFDACAASGGMLQSPVSASATPGRRIGAYELVRELGRGGMGAVWLARRADREFHKEVAIKLLKRGTDTDEVLRRFRAEREILARLEHPNIARLLDGGTTEDGLPYFVMEYVVGTRVTDFVAAQQLALGDRLQLFLKICSAVELAHQNLVVHRDLKPANILVTSTGEPKLLDFGIAKLLGASGEVWEVTIAGRERLTPGYASPEQVRGDPVTTVSDVYALGAILYELLADRPAHRFGLAQPTATEVLRVVCDEEPLRPSVATPSREMRRSLRGDLDTIVLRALAKAPSRRYRGAGSLADDVRRYLDGRPVRARPDTVSYRAAKFIGRNKLGAVAAVLLLATLIGGAATTLWQARRADRRFAEVRKIANSFMFEFHDAIRDLPGSLAARQLVVERAVEYLDTLAREAGNDLALKSELATAYIKIAQLTFDIARAIESVGKAIALNESLVAAAPQNVSYGVQLAESYRTQSDMLKISGQSAPAIEKARRGLAAMESLASRLPPDAETQLSLGHHHMALAVALADAGDFRRALESESAALALAEKALGIDPQSAHATRDLAGSSGRLSALYVDAGEPERAISAARRALAINQPISDAEPANARYRRQLWGAHFHLAQSLAMTPDLHVTLEHYATAAELMAELSAADPGDKGHRRWLAVTYSEMGEVLSALGRPREARARQEAAIAISEDLARDDASRVESRRDLVRMHTAAGRLALAEEPQRALDHLRRATAFGEELAERDPHNAETRAALADAHAALADSHHALAIRPGVPADEQRSHLLAARDLYARSVANWRDVESKGMLTSRHRDQPAATERALAKCAATLALPY